MCQTICFCSIGSIVYFEKVLIFFDLSVLYKYSYKLQLVENAISFEKITCAEKLSCNVECAWCKSIKILGRNNKDLVKAYLEVVGLNPRRYPCALLLNYAVFIKFIARNSFEIEGAF